MAIKNYTTKIDALTSIGEIQKALAESGALKVMIDYRAGKAVSLSFALETARGLQGFTLPASTEGTMQVFAAQKIKANREQAEMTAWRNVRDWVLAQIALVESSAVPMDQVFLPYLSDQYGRTLYELYAGGQLLLGDGREEERR